MTVAELCRAIGNFTEWLADNGFVVAQCDNAGEWRPITPPHADDIALRYMEHVSREGVT